MHKKAMGAHGAHGLFHGRQNALPGCCRNASSCAVLARPTDSLTVTLSVDEAGGIGFDAPGVTSAALFGWLAALKAEYGVETRGLTVIENADATLDASGRIGG